MKMLMALTPELASIPETFETGSSSPVPFFHFLERLKTTKREGWRRFGIRDGESIAEHQYRMSIMTMLAPPALAAKLDLAKCMRMALIHDMAEALVGDITPVEKIAKEDKSRMEASTIDYVADRLLGKVANVRAGEELRKIWWEYEDGKTLESKFVHDIDKMELLLQMLEYERSHEISLEEFGWVAHRISLPEVKTWWEDLRKEREALWESRGVKTSELPVDQATKKLEADLAK